MAIGSTRTGLEALLQAVHRLNGSAHDYDPPLEAIGDAHFVLIGEASHDTYEFYRERARITRRLIAEKGFTAVAVEADWPDAYRVNCYVRDRSDDADPGEALSDFQRFPSWMWRNIDVADFVAWIRAHNDSLPLGERKVDFYGLDLYSLHASIEAVIGCLDIVDPEAAKRARARYSCFDHFGKDPQSYEGLFHTAGIPHFLLRFRDGGHLSDALGLHKLERAIGVNYLPETKRISHYFYADLPAQFDVVLHFDETHALEPLESTSRWEDGEETETFQFAA